MANQKKSIIHEERNASLPRIKLAYIDLEILRCRSEISAPVVTENNKHVQVLMNHLKNLLWKFWDLISLAFRIPSLPNLLQVSAFKNRAKELIKTLRRTCHIRFPECLCVQLSRSSYGLFPVQPKGSNHGMLPKLRIKSTHPTSNKD